MTDISRKLLTWYDAHGRTLPWRARRGDTIDPYRVWLSEIMLQQTTVAAVGPYFARFVGKWPTMEKLAAAPLDDVLATWAGLGYYARARNLHKCAQEVAARHGGHLPADEATLLSLPGIGRYTAAAITAIAYDRPAAVIDGNVERVMARVFAIGKPLKEVKTRLRDHAESLLPQSRFGDHAQALMDLGATICTPRAPKCLLCPIAGDCEARRRGLAETLPLKSKKSERPVRVGAAFFVQRSDGTVLLRRRPAHGLLGGMLEVPSSPWRSKNGGSADLLSHAPLKAKWTRRDGLVEHTFTHFHLQLEVYTARVKRPRKLNGTYRWSAVGEFDTLALPTVMRKVARHALDPVGT